MRTRAKKLAGFLAGRAADMDDSDGNVSHYWQIFQNCKVYSTRKNKRNAPGDIIMYSGILSDTVPLHESSAMRVVYVYEQDDSFVHVYHTTQRSFVDGYYVFGATFDGVNPDIPFITECGEKKRHPGTVRFHNHKISMINDMVWPVVRPLFDKEHIHDHNTASCTVFQDFCRRYVEHGDLDTNIQNLKPDILQRINMVVPKKG